MEETDSILSKSPQILPLNLNEAHAGINYLETSSVENKNPEQITQGNRMLYLDPQCFIISLKEGESRLAKFFSRAIEENIYLV